MEKENVIKNKIKFSKIHYIFLLFIILWKNINTSPKYSEIKMIIHGTGTQRILNNIWHSYSNVYSYNVLIVDQLK